MSRGERFAELDPAQIWFTHARIRPFFSGCGIRVEDTLNQIINKQISVDILPFITVIENNGNYFSLNNRRLYVLKNLRERGLLENNSIQVRIKPALERERDRYLPSKCSLQATIMGERSGGSAECRDDGDEVCDKGAPITLRDDEAVIPEGPSTSASASEAVGSSAAPQSKPQNGKKASSNNWTSALPKAVMKEIVTLSRQVESGKRKKALETIDCWSRSGIITAEQKSLICTEIGLE